MTVRQRFAPGAIGLVFGILLAPPALAFGTVNSLGQAAQHEKITRKALGSLGFERKSLDEIVGRTGTWGAVGAPDDPARGLSSEKQAHCDGGDYLAEVANYPHDKLKAQEVLTGCRTWIVANLEAAVIAAGAMLNADGSINDAEIPTFFSCTYLGQPGRAKCNAVEALGLALHASQDFYSHTNWTDHAEGQVSITNPPGLNGGGRAPWLDPRKTVAFPDGLLSGCFDGIIEALHCDGRVKHEVLNKDKGPISAQGVPGKGTTPRAKGNDNFARAIDAAVDDTNDKWRYFTERAVAVHGKERGQRIVCAMQKDNPVKTCP